MNQGSFELQVVVSGHPVREYGHQGRTFIEGRRGSVFVLKFRNNSSSQVLAIPSVDGISVIDGQPATADSRGYVVPGYSAVEIKGWRKDLGTSADFVFTDRSKSYAAQTAGAQNLGVVAVKVFAQKPVELPKFLTEPLLVREEHHHHHHHHHPPVYPTVTPIWVTTTGGSSAAGIPTTGGVYACCTQDTSASLCASAAAPAFSLGTGWGAEKVDKVGEVSFERGLELATLELFYDDAAGLTAYGVQLSKDVALSAPSFPVAFGGFCKPPVVTV